MPHVLLASVMMFLMLAMGGVSPASAQTEPEGRQITHREQSLKPYDPFSAEELFKKIKIPPAPALSPEDAIKSFQVAPGFRIECVASEPLVVDPVFFEFDPDGRIWAVEFRGWMIDINGTGEGDPICQIVVLEDTDGDTIMDKSTVFLDKLVMPRTVSFVDGGVLVAEPPSLWYCRDTDGDLKCDSKELVGKYGKPGNPEHTDNSLMHALDNWMYNAKSTVRHKFIDGKLIEEPTVFRGQWGMAQDDYGRLFYCYENSSLHGDLIPAEYIQRNPHAPVPRRRDDARVLNVNLATEAHEVFPIRVTPGITLGGTELRPDGRLKTFTIACGLTIYRGDQFPPQYYGSAIIPEAAGNLVRLDLLESDGVHIKARNAFDQRELVASTDERFRPVCSRTGPDGALYVCDLYRGIIEHVIFMMPYLRNQILSRGLDKPVHLGRIYRIVHEGKPLGPQPKLSKASNAQLVETLSHPNGWWRDTAQRLLVERKAIDATDALRKLATEGKSNVGRVHALWTLDGIGKLDWNTAIAAMEAEDTMVRATAIRLSERAKGGPSISWLQGYGDDQRPMVRLQLMLSLGELTNSQGAEVGGVGVIVKEAARDSMLEILVNHPDPVFRAALVSGTKDCELEMIERLLGQSEWTQKTDWTQEKEQSCGAIAVLSTCVVHAGDAKRVERLTELAALVLKGQPWATRSIIAGMAASDLAAKRWPEPLQLTERPKVLELLADVSTHDQKQQLAKLLRIITWPGDATVREMKPVLTPLTAEQEKLRVMGESVYSVTCLSCHKPDGRGQPSQAPPLADSEWVNGPPDRLIRIALHGLRGPVKVNGEEWNLQMPGLGFSPVLNDRRMAGVLTYVRRAWDNYGSPIEPEQVAAIRQSAADRTVPWTIEEILDPTKVAKAAASDPLEPYRSLLGKGDPEKGRFLFHANREIRCNACHKVGNLGGGFVGPNLSDIGKRQDREYLLQSLIEPSAKIVKGFETLVVETDSGVIVSGTFVSEDAKQLVVALPAGGEKKIAINEIVERIQSPVSSMPPMGNAFTPQQIADIVAYLQTLEEDIKATDAPNAKTGATPPSQEK